MTAADLVFGTLAVAAGIWAGASLSGTAGAVVGGLLGLAAAATVTTARIRFVIAVPVLAGTLAGGMLGRSIVHALCLPSGCHGAEVAAALVTGAGSLVGVGLVVALVVRSFDEYRETNSKREGPP